MGLQERAKAYLLRSSELRGIFSKELKVPESTRAYVVWDDGSSKILRAGELASGEFQAILTRALPFELPFMFHNVLSQEGYEGAVSCSLELCFGDQQLDFEALRSHLLARTPEIENKLLEVHFAEQSERALRRWLATRKAADVYRDGPAGLLEVLADALKQQLFEAGMLLQDVVAWKYSCETFERIRVKEAEALAQVEDARREESARDEANRLKKDNILKALQYEREVDDQVLSKKVAQFENLREKLGGDENRAMIALLEDDQAKRELIERLVEREMTPEQIRARKVEEIEARFQKQYQALLKAVASRGAVDTDALVCSQRMLTRRVLVVLGKQILAFDPTTNLDPDVPKERYDFRNHSLGYLRSIRAYRREGNDELYAGAQRGIYRVIGEQVTEFPFPRLPQGKGGTNSVAVFGDQLYATHSEVGLCVWDTRGLTPPRTVWQDLTRGRDSVRGAFVDGMGNLYFSAGNQIFRSNLVKDDDLTTFNGARQAITAFLVVDQSLVAGDKSGRIMIWKLSDPNSPRQFRVLKPNPIYMLKSAMLRGLPHLLIGAKDYGVTAAVLDGDRDIEFRCQEPIRWVGGASDMIYGVDRTGYRVICWAGQKPGGPAASIRVADAIQDLYVIKEPAA